jgi:hypothetical protein
MENIETPLSDTPERADADAAHRCLQSQLNVMLAILVLLSGTVCAYFYRQLTYSRKDLDLFRPQAQQAIEAYERDKPILNDFLKKMTDYAATHPDFMPIAVKYGLANPPPATASPPSAAPQTAPAKK